MTPAGHLPVSFPDPNSRGWGLETRLRPIRYQKVERGNPYHFSVVTTEYIRCTRLVDGRLSLSFVAELNVECAVLDTLNCTIGLPELIKASSKGMMSVYTI